MTTINSADKCVHCGVCRKNCDFLNKYGIDIGDTDRLRELAYHCFLCGKCTEVCPIHIDGKEIILNLRREIASDDKQAIENKYKSTVSEKKNYKFRNWKNVTDGAVFFPGCNFPSLYPKLTKELSKIFAENGIGTVYECCGKPIAELGLKDDEDRILSELKDRLGQNNISEIIVACPNCRGFFGDRLGIKVTSIYTKLNELGVGNIIEEDIKLFIPCPDRQARQWVEELKPFVKGEISYVDGIQCCGLGGIAIACEPELSKGFTEKFKQQEQGAILTYCASCTGRIRRNGFDSINHIATKILGIDEAPATSISYLNRVLTKFK